MGKFATKPRNSKSEQSSSRSEVGGRRSEVGMRHAECGVEWSIRKMMMCAEGGCGVRHAQACRVTEHEIPNSELELLPNSVLEPEHVIPNSDLRIPNWNCFQIRLRIGLPIGVNPRRFFFGDRSLASVGLHVDHDSVIAF